MVEKKKKELASDNTTAPVPIYLSIKTDITRLV